MGQLRIQRFFRKIIRAIQLVNWLVKLKSQDLQSLALEALRQKERSESDEWIVQRYMSHLPYFIKIKQKYGHELFVQVCKYIYLEAYEANATVININQEGKVFYIIIQGSVGVNIYLPSEEGTHFVRQQVNTLGAGDSFGELALEETTKTTATVITLSKCYFACMTKGQFSEVLGQINVREIREKVEFLRTLGFLREWYENDLKTLSYHFQLEKFTRGQAVYWEGEKVRGVRLYWRQISPYLYFVKSGTFEVFKTVVINGELGRDIDRLIRKEHPKQQILLCELQPTHVFGLEHFQERPTRQYSVKATSFHSEVYKICQADLDRRLWLGNSKQVLLEMVADIARFRASRERQVIAQLGIQKRIEGIKQKKENHNLRQLIFPDKKVAAPQSSGKLITTRHPKFHLNFLEVQKPLDCLRDKNDILPQLNRKLKSRSFATPAVQPRGMRTKTENDDPNMLLAEFFASVESSQLRPEPSEIAKFKRFTQPTYQAVEEVFSARIKQIEDQLEYDQGLQKLQDLQDRIDNAIWLRDQLRDQSDEIEEEEQDGVFNFAPPKEIATPLTAREPKKYLFSNREVLLRQIKDAISKVSGKGQKKPKLSRLKTIELFNKRTLPTEVSQPTQKSVFNFNDTIVTSRITTSTNKQKAYTIHSKFKSSPRNLSQPQSMFRRTLQIK